MKMLLLIFLQIFILSSVAGAVSDGLKEALREYLSVNSRWPDASIAIDNVKVYGEGFLNKEGNTFIITPRHRSRTTGRISFNVTLEKGAGRVASSVVTANVRYMKKVVVTSRPIRMRERIGSDDVRLSAMDISSIPVTAAISIDDVVGKSAKRPLSEGRVVREDYLQKTPMIKRGQTLDVRVRSAAIVVRTKARALSDGFLGGPVKATTAGGREISGEVSGPGQMVINLR